MKHVLFLHVPKTAGISIHTMISQHDGPLNPAHQTYFIEQTDWASVETYKYFFSHAPLYVRRVLPQPLFVFTFLRDPVDRIVSAYNHMLRAPGDASHEVIVEKRLDVAGALTHPLPSVWLTDAATRLFGADIDLRPVLADRELMTKAHKLAWETKADEFTYRRALARIAELDFVGFTERMQDDCRRLAELLGFTIDSVPVENVKPADYPWPLPVAVRSPEIEDAVRQHSMFDVRLYEAARKAFWPADGARPLGSAWLRQHASSAEI